MERISKMAGLYGVPIGSMYSIFARIYRKKNNQVYVNILPYMHPMVYGIISKD